MLILPFFTCCKCITVLTSSSSDSDLIIILRFNLISSLNSIVYSSDYYNHVFVWSHIVIVSQ